MPNEAGRSGDEAMVTQQSVLHVMVDTLLFESELLFGFTVMEVLKVALLTTIYEM